MVKIRLKRLGYKKNPIYRIIVINSREKREGRPIEELGFYNPKRKELKLNKAAALEWISKGAQPTETVNYLITNSDDNGNLVRKAETTAKKLSKKAAAKAQEAKKEEPKKEEAKVEEVKAEEAEPKAETEETAEATA